MTPEEKYNAIKALSYDERVAKYKPLRNAGRVSLKEYAYIIYSIPYQTALKETGEARTELGQPSTDDRSDAGSNGSGKQADGTLSQESFVAHMERNDKDVLPERADGNSSGQDRQANETPDTAQLDAGRTDADKTGSQKGRLLELLMDGNWHTTPDIQTIVYGRNHLGVARIGARADDLRNEGHTIESKKVSKTIWAYRLVEKNVRWVSENIASG